MTCTSFMLPFATFTSTDRAGRRDILRIHTRKMKDGGALSQDAIDMIENLDDNGMGARTEHFSGAELAGLVRSAASYALARAVESEGSGEVTAIDLEKALDEVRPALGTQVSGEGSIKISLQWTVC